MKAGLTVCSTRWMLIATTSILSLTSLRSSSTNSPQWSNYTKRSAAAGKHRTGMKTKDILKRVKSLTDPFRVDSGKKFRLKEIDPGETLHLTAEDKPAVQEALTNG